MVTYGRPITEALADCRTKVDNAGSQAKETQNRSTSQNKKCSDLQRTVYSAKPAAVQYYGKTQQELKLTSTGSSHGKNNNFIPPMLSE